MAAHADWSTDPRKRWVTVASREGRGWRVGAARPVGPVGDFLPGLLAEAGGGAVALGVDLPVGVPRAYAARLDAPDFPAFLRGLGAWPDFFSVCERVEELRLDRPFYPRRSVRGMTRAAHAAALGLGGPEGLSRLCDRATADRPAGAPLFWTLGANQSGKAAIAAWRDMLLPALAGASPPRLWPFEGPFLSLLAPGRVALAETYPAEALRHLGLRMGGSKRRQLDRAALAGALLERMAALGAEPDAAQAASLRDGFGVEAAGEDRFDSLLGLLCVLKVLAGGRPDAAPADPWILRWEGWVLGQTALPRDLAASVRSCASSPPSGR
ncbi:MAG: hypothetical protein JSR21_21185 [Proteobacteria bacterium]|nr:hypothetical protein [Pseudomonadota bacterium]